MTRLKYVFWEMDGRATVREHVMPDLGVPVVVPAYVENLSLIEDLKPGGYGVLPCQIVGAPTEIEDYIAEANRDPRLHRLLTRPVDPWIFALHDRAREILGVPKGHPLESGTALMAMHAGEFHTAQQWPTLPADLESAWRGLPPSACMALALEIVCPARELHTLGRYSCGEFEDSAQAITQDLGWDHACRPYSPTARLLGRELAHQPILPGDKGPTDARVAELGAIFLTDWARHIRRQMTGSKRKLKVEEKTVLLNKAGLLAESSVWLAITKGMASLLQEAPVKSVRIAIDRSTSIETIEQLIDDGEFAIVRVDPILEDLFHDRKLDLGEGLFLFKHLDSLYCKQALRLRVHDIASGSKARVEILNVHDSFGITSDELFSAVANGEGGVAACRRKDAMAKNSLGTRAVDRLVIIGLVQDGMDAPTSE